ncbi:nicotinamide riboside transporter PnuC [Chitinophaga rhizophila]|uniref:Nicotinamide riboside transporter PnuC n=1 Tax=Chitinophaga rhizophila TaxID=2866212 RepID=A0ABS7GHF8_9BACT|nr:nicotinamide riboside transporter PnuC [Chitinophaga rhizophila]MBW8686087.1 nicotinamide riboside transporter PnuC [Chitinophaga rhizophila]
MNFDALYQGLQEGLQAMTWLEVLAALFGAISVLCSKANSIWLYPTGLVSTGIYAYLLSKEQFRLYAEATLNVYYFIMSVYGWYHWAKKGAGQPGTPITKANRADWLITFLITAIGWALFSYLLRTFSNSDVPLIDAFVSATACAGMWLLAKRKLENWILLNVSNLVAIPLLFHKHLLPTALLTIFLFVVAVMGYFSWKKIWVSQQTPGLAK